MYTSTLSSLVFGFHLLLSLPQAFLKSPLLNLSDVAFSTIFKEMPSVDITKSLQPFLLASLATSFYFLAFSSGALSSGSTSMISFSSGGIKVPSMMSSYALLSAMTLNFKANSCQFSFVLLNLYTLMLLRSSFSSLTLMIFTLFNP